MAIIRNPNETREASIIVQTRKKTAIDNLQSLEFSPSELAQFPNYETKYKVDYRTEPNPVYNCHGLTFASRRTSVFPPDLQIILEEDGYTEILDRQKILPGDVILYPDNSGSIIHSGIVVEEPNNNNFQVPKIVSKWGKFREAVHYANVGPYSEEYSNARYFRVTR